MSALNADRWLYTQLTTDSELASALGGRVYAEIAPQKTAYPLAVITFVAANHVGNASADRIMDNELWQIVVWTDQPNYTTIESIVDRIRAALHKASGAGVIGAVYEGRRRLSEGRGDDVRKGIVLEFRLFTQ